MTIHSQKRLSNLELLRVLCIVAIIADHFIGQNSLAVHVSLPESFFYILLTSLSRVGCSVFVIISAWFSVDMSFRFRKILHIWLTVAMFSLPFLVWELTHPGFSEEQMQMLAYPVEERPLWFAGYFIVLMGFSPVLNMILREGSRKLTEYILFFFGILMTGYCSVTARQGFFSSDIWPMVFLYLLTGYWKKYRGIPSLSTARRCFCITFLFLVGGRVLCHFLPAGIAVNVLKRYMEAYRTRMQTLPNLLMAYGLFFAFYHLKIRQSMTINRLAGLSLGVYCFHQLPGWYPFLWDGILHASYHAKNLPGVQRVLYTVTGIAATWILGNIIEYIRSRISGLLIEKRHWFGQLCRYADHLVNGQDESLSRRDRVWIGWFVLAVLLWFMITPVFFSSQMYNLLQ